MILEGIVTTVDAGGLVRISPMGPIVDASMTRLEFRPFQTSSTFRNLCRTRQGVFHVTDDVELLARAAVDRLVSAPRLERAKSVEGWILADACRWYAFEIREIDERQERARLLGVVVDRGQVRDFFGFNRAKHAVVEAAILATRVSILPPEEITAELRRLAVMVDKTGGEQEHRAFDFLTQHVAAAMAGLPQAAPSGMPQPIKTQLRPERLS